MKHCILVKFIKSFDWQSELSKIATIFDSIDINGVHKTEYLVNCIDRENRYDLLIRIDMEKEALEKYDMSEAVKIMYLNLFDYMENPKIIDPEAYAEIGKAFRKIEQNN